MPASETHGRSVVAWRIARSLLFVALIPVIYTGVVFCLAAVYLDGQQLLQKVVGPNAEQGGYGFSLERFREVERSPSVDVVFLGSSHCYRSFDPRMFAARGLRAFNLGSSGQAPLNSYYVLKRYWARLKPRLVVLEAYPVMMGEDGLESFDDLALNTKAWGELAEMVVAMRDFHAMNLLFSTYFGNLWKPLDGVRQNRYTDQEYVPGGYCASFGRATMSEADIPQIKIGATGYQIEYVKRILRFAKQRNAAVAVVVQPLPRRFLSRIDGYWAVSEQIGAAARELGAPFWDMNSAQTGLDDVEDFKDIDHLNPSGAAKFNEAVLAKLAEAGLTPRP